MNSFSQYVEFYAQIDDNTFIPKSIKDEKTNDIVLKSQNDDLNDILKDYKIEKFEQAFPTAPTLWLRKIYKVKCDKKELGEKLKTKFKEEIPLVEYLCEPDLTYTPNDYGLAGGQTNLDLINTKNAWDICKEIPKISIAITDSYFDLNHEDLSLTLIGGNNSSISNHGTAVAGLVAAITDNDKGLASVGFDTNLFVSSDYGVDNEVLRLAQDGYRVINCSWYNTCQYSSVQDSLYNVIRNTYNTVVVFGAGNADWRHCGNNNPDYPASYSSNIAVTSVGHIYNVGTQGSPANNWKDVHEEVIGDSLSAHKHHPTMDICAPGYNVETSDIMGSGGDYSGNYGNQWGTSFAAPQVSATVGLILSINPCLSANEAVNILLSTTDNSIYDIPENSYYSGRLGTGRLNVFAAVNAAAESATRYLQYQTLSGTQMVKSNYAIRVTGNGTVPSGANVNFITRKEVSLDGPFEVATGATFSIDVNVNNDIGCN